MTISRLLYVDDSGAVDRGLIVYGWLEVTPDRWRHGLRTILELRKQLYRDHQVPPATELHATKFVNGQNQGGRPATMQSLKGEIEVIAPEEFASAKAVFPKPKL